MDAKYILTFSCPDTSGIQAKVTGLLYKNKVFLTDVQSYSDSESKTFFSRTVFIIEEKDNAYESLVKELGYLANELQMKWSIDIEGRKIKTLIAVSKLGHCLNDLLYRTKYRDMPVEIVGVISNHETYREIVEFNGIDFHYLPIEKNAESKRNQENKINSIAESYDVELLVLARYMQILSADFSAKWSGKCINIHHSFLPSFKGAKPYHQAFDKGVKIIGATSHFVTSDLDEGPIIEQNIERVSHSDTAEDLTRKGNDIESSVLSRSVRWYSEKKVLINGTKTIVFN
ncbi:MAG: formyltetrahydrofolate deformylase [Gammaproteobacteria bacterium]|jgi:formyltetrahydrofolate deformylase|tara:strand:+ start:2835 stop:3695 length:861 start_codon:yes stop_codon:yes gene_type:complete